MTQPVFREPSVPPPAGTRSAQSIWDDPELRPGGDFVRFDSPGDTVSGVISAIKAHRFEDGSVAPQVHFIDDTDGEDKTLTVGQIKLKLLFHEERPEPGDWFQATYTEQERRAGGKTLKHFNLTVNRGGSPATNPSGGARQATAPTAAPAQNSVPAAAPVTPELDQAALAAALSALTPEQRAGMGLPG